MAKGAAHILGRVLDLQGLGFGDLFRARACQGSRGPLRMKISEGPHQKLVLLLPAAAVTAGAGARIRAEKLGRDFVRTLDGGDVENVGERTSRIGQIRADPIVVTFLPRAHRHY